jgi:predicted transcriptional regulator
MALVQSIPETETLVRLAVEVVVAHVSNNDVAVGDTPTLLASVYDILAGKTAKDAPEDPAGVPAVSVRSSIKPDYLVCLEDGKKLKMMKRYLMTRYGLTPEDYRAKWNLPADYPMVAPNYSERRRKMAKEIGLGRLPTSPRKTKAFKR